MKIYKVTFSNGFQTHLDWNGIDFDVLKNYVWDIYDVWHGDRTGVTVVSIEYVVGS